MSNHQENVLEDGVSGEMTQVKFCIYRTTIRQCLRTVLMGMVDVLAPAA